MAGPASDLLKHATSGPEPRRAHLEPSRAGRAQDRTPGSVGDFVTHCVLPEDADSSTGSIPKAGSGLANLPAREKVSSSPLGRVASFETKRSGLPKPHFLCNIQQTRPKAKNHRNAGPEGSSGNRQGQAPGPRQIQVTVDQPWQVSVQPVLKPPGTESQPPPWETDAFPNLQPQALLLQLPPGFLSYCQWTRRTIDHCPLYNVSEASRFPLQLAPFLKTKHAPVL